MNIQQFHSALSESDPVEDFALLDRLRGVEALQLSEDDGSSGDWPTWPPG